MTTKVSANSKNQKKTTNIPPFQAQFLDQFKMIIEERKAKGAASDELSVLAEMVGKKFHLKPAQARKKAEIGKFTKVVEMMNKKFGLTLKIKKNRVLY